MKWNAFDYISPAIDLTKKLLFPINFKKWLKLGFISLLSSNSGGGGGVRFPNFNLGPIRDFSGVQDNSVTGMAVGKLTDNASTKWGIFAVILIPIFILIVLLMYIRAVFTFIFLEAVTTKNISIKKSFSRHNPKGVSLFALNIVVGIITLVIIGLLAVPFVLTFFKGGGQPLWLSVGIAYLIFAIALIFIYLIALGIFYMIIYDLAVPLMFFKNLPVMFSLKTVSKNLKRDWVEFIVYILAKIVLAIASAILALIAIIIVGIPLVIIFILFGILFYFVGVALAWTLPYIVFLGIVAIIVFILVLYLFAVVLLPISVFFRYYTLLVLEKVMGQKLPFRVLK